MEQGGPNTQALLRLNALTLYTGVQKAAHIVHHADVQ